MAKLPEGADPLRLSVEPLMPMVLSYETQKCFGRYNYAKRAVLAKGDAVGKLVLNVIVGFRKAAPKKKPGG